jgi:chemotaxis signal transduction protein
MNNVVASLYIKHTPTKKLELACINLRNDQQMIIDLASKMHMDKMKNNQRLLET